MIIQKPVADYGNYVYIQGGKARTQKDKILSSVTKRRKAFFDLFMMIKSYMLPGNLLCLGARSGCEVVGAALAGFPKTIGIDLFPLDKSVIKADWHDMPFPDENFKNVFTNSIDHCADLEKLIFEIKRVLIPAGRFILAASYGQKIGRNIKDRAKKNSKEFLFWEHPKEISDVFVKNGFSLIYETQFSSDKIYILQVNK